MLSRLLVYPIVLVIFKLKGRVAAIVLQRGSMEEVSLRLFLCGLRLLSVLRRTSMEVVILGCFRWRFTAIIFVVYFYGGGYPGLAGYYYFLRRTSMEEVI